MINIFENLSLKKVFEIEEYLLRKNMLRIVTQKLQVWNGEVILTKKRKLNYDMEAIIVLYHKFYAFILTMYETTKFNRIIVTQAISFKKYSAQVDYARSLGDYFITKWLPGMFTGREYFVRNFYYKWFLGFKIFKKSKLRSCISQLYKIIRLPSLLCVYTFKRENQIIVKEAVTNKVISIGMFENFIFPTNSAFRLTGRVNTVYSTCIFLNIIILAMNYGKSLYYKRFSINMVKDGESKQKNKKRSQTKQLLNFENFIITLIRQRKFKKEYKLENRVKIVKKRNKVRKTQSKFFFLILLLHVAIQILQRDKKKNRIYLICYRKLIKNRIRKIVNFYLTVFFSTRKKVRRRPRFKYFLIRKKQKNILRKSIKLIKKMAFFKLSCWKLTERLFFKNRIKTRNVK